MSIKGAAWVLGILLVVGMFLVARGVLDPSSATTSSKDRKAVEADRAPNMVVCWGYFDVESGINRALFPKQLGDIAFVVAENSKVKEGQVLLQINDALAQLKLKEAVLAVKAAKLQRDDAENLRKLYPLQAEQQKAAIAAVDEEIKEVQKDRDSKLKTLKGEPIFATVEERYGFALAKLAEKRKAEDARLKQINLQDAELKIAQAQAEFDAKELLVKQATEMLRYFQVVAPRDGYILRVNVKKGEALGPNPMMPALEFLPDLPIIVRAEILQEWGRYIKDGKDGQLVEIEDDVYHGPKWEGKVRTMSKWYAQTRTPVIEPFRYNDVRTLECIIELKDAKDAPVARIGQRVRAKIKL